MTKISLDLAQILEAKYPQGFHVPADIDLTNFLEFADDDWTEELDLDALLAEERKAAIIITAQQVKNDFPHLSDEQAWEVVEITRDQTQLAIDDFIADVVHFNFPSTKMELHSRLMNLRYRLNGKGDATSKQLQHELSGLLRLFHKLPDTLDGNPALEGIIAATLDDIETAVNPIGGGHE